VHSFLRRQGDLSSCSSCISYCTKARGWARTGASTHLIAWQGIEQYSRAMSSMASMHMRGAHGTEQQARMRVGALKGAAEH